MSGIDRLGLALGSITPMGTFCTGVDQYVCDDAAVYSCPSGYTWSCANFKCDVPSGKYTCNKTTNQFYCGTFQCVPFFFTPGYDCPPALSPSCTRYAC